MKKLFVILLTLALMITLIGNVSADTNLNFGGPTGDTTKTTDVQYQVSPTYMITVPPGISFTKAPDEVHGWVNATNLVLEADAIVTVSVTSQYGGEMFTLNAQGSSTVGAGLDYKLYTRDYSLDQSFSAEEVVLTAGESVEILRYVIPSGKDVPTIEKRIELKFTLDTISGKQNLLSGTYKDTLTFTASYSGTLINQGV